MIKVWDYNKEYKVLRKKILKSVDNVFKSGTLVFGPALDKFERNFTQYIGAKYGLGVGNGTDALEIAVKSLGLPKNSEIIVPNNTWISTAEAVINNGFKVIFCDVNLNDYSICIQDLKKKLIRKPLQ